MQLPTFARSLSARLLLLTIVFVMIAEVLIYLPSAARYRADWLAEKLASGHLAALAVEAAPDQMVTDELEAELLRHVGALAIDVTKPAGRMLMLSADMPPEAQVRFDLREAGPVTLIADALGVLMQDEPKVIAVTGRSPKNPDVLVTVTLNDRPLCDGLWAFSGRILLLSLFISGITAGLVYVTLIYMTVRPMRRLVEAMMAFKRDPESAEPEARLATNRSDEVGIAQRELIALQAAVRQALRQRERLVALGTAVAKINHDIRGVLASATLLSERLLDSRDPEVRQNGPRILASLERAALLVSQTLDYTRDGVVPAERSPVDPRALVAEVMEGLAAERAAPANGTGPDLRNAVPEGLVLPAERELLFRGLSNLVRNAVEAGASHVTVAAEPAGDMLRLLVVDDGPGLPEKAQAHLFQPFAGSTKANGTGLGLSIAREVARAHGGELRLAETSGKGTTFAMTLPVGG